MKDEVIFRRRQRLKYHFVHTSKVLLYGYHDLSDAAKVTYQVIDGFDWEDKETGDSKGYVFPAVETIAEIRGISERTIQRHIKELEEAGLLTRMRRRYQASVLYIEDVSQKEIDRYIEIFVDRRSGGSGSSGQGSPSSDDGAARAESHATRKSRNAKSVVSRQAPETTKLSLLEEANLNSAKEEELRKNKNVNVVQDRAGEMQSMQALLERRVPRKPPTQPSREAPPEHRAKRDYLARTLADEFNDTHGLGCYRRIAEKIPEAVIFQILAEVKDAGHRGKIRSSRAGLFVDAIKRYASSHEIDLKFGARRGKDRRNWVSTTGP